MGTLGGSLGDPWGTLLASLGAWRGTAERTLEKKLHFAKEWSAIFVSSAEDWVDGCSEKGSPCGAQGAKMAPQSDHFSVKNGSRNSNQKQRGILARKAFCFLVFFS